MKIVVVFETMFGNTGKIGESIADGLRPAGEVRVGSVDEVPPAEVKDADLVVVGGPTQNHGMARTGARQTLAQDPAQKYGKVLPGEESLRHWLDQLPDGRGWAATFDTRYDKPAWLTGSAAKKISRVLGRKGYQVADVRSFFVEGTAGPLAEGERDRAAAWGRELAATVTAADAG